MLQLIYFSPTGGVKKVLEAVASGLSVETHTITDLTLPVREADALRGDLVLVGAPVYGQRLPQEFF